MAKWPHTPTIEEKFRDLMDGKQPPANPYLQTWEERMAEEYEHFREQFAKKVAKILEQDEQKRVKELMEQRMKEQPPEVEGVGDVVNITFDSFFAGLVDYLHGSITFLCKSECCWNEILRFITHHNAIFSGIHFIGIVIISYSLVKIIYNIIFWFLFIVFKILILTRAYCRLLVFRTPYAEFIRILSGLIFLGALIASLHLWYLFDPEESGFQFVYSISLIEAYGIDFIIGIDGISLCFLLLTTFIMFLCWFAALPIQKNYREFIVCLLLIELFLILSFIMVDLFFFYVFFESVLIPMFIIIGFWGARARKIKAAYYFFLYTLFGSLFMLFGILYIYTLTGTTDFYVLLNSTFSYQQQLKLWLCFFIPFAIKIPMFPFHIWLPEAHVEAPTIGSVILASLLLKLGSYGLLRFTLPLFPMGSQFFSPLVYTLAVVSVIYASLITIRQIDLKRIIAYSSVAHMNLIVLGLFSYTQQGIDGAIYLMIGHGIVSSALFFCIGVLYDRHHTRLLKYYGGLIQTMPIFSIFFFFFTMANMSFPGTSNFIGELLILVGVFEKNSLIMFFSATGIVLSAVYSIWLYNRIVFGALKVKYMPVKAFKDLTYSEKFILSSLTIEMFILGLYSEFVTELTAIPVSMIIHNMYI